MNSIEFKYHPTQKASYRIKRVLIQILSGHVLELILTEIFYGFLNIYKTLRILPEQILSNFACQSRKSDFGWYSFRFSPCLMRKRVEKSEAILELLLA